MIEKKRKRFTFDDRKMIEKLYTIEKKPPSQIAYLLKKSISGIRTEIDRYAIDGIYKADIAQNLYITNQSQKTWTLEDGIKEEVINDYNLSYSINKISRLHNLSRNKIKKIINEYELKKQVLPKINEEEQVNYTQSIPNLSDLYKLVVELTRAYDTLYQYVMVKQNE